MEKCAETGNKAGNSLRVWRGGEAQEGFFDEGKKRRSLLNGVRQQSHLGTRKKYEENDNLWNPPNVQGIHARKSKKGEETFLKN